MGVPKKIYVLDDGQNVTVNDVMHIAEIKLTAARHRLAQGRDPAKVLAKKGLHVDQGYAKITKKKKPKKRLNKALMIQAKEMKAEKKKKAEQIRNRHPFYDKGEAGKLHRILFGKW